MYAAGKIPGGFFKREGQADRAGHPDRPDDRPSDPAALAEGLQERGPGHRHHALHRSCLAARHPGDQRRLGGADDLLAAVHGPGRRGPDRTIDGELVVDPTLAEVEQGDSTLDLIVVGTKDALTMVEAGAGDPRGHRSWRRSSRRTTRSAALRHQEDLQRQLGKAKLLDRELTEELEERRATGSASDPGEGLREGPTAIEEIVEEISPGHLTMESTEDDIIRRMQVRGSSR